MTSEEYQAAKMVELAMQGVEADNIINLIDAQNKLTEAKAQEKQQRELTAIEEQEVLGAAEEVSGPLFEALQMQARLDLMAEETAQRLELLQQRGAGEAEMWALYNDYQLQSDQQTAQMKKSIALGTAGALVNISQSLLSATGTQSMAAFRAYQTLAIGQTIISTISAARKTFDAYAGIGGPVGPILGAIAAAVVMAAGMKSVNDIRKTKPGGAASVSGGSLALPSSSGASLGSASIDGTTPPRNAEQQVQNIVINIQTLTGQIDEVAADEIIRVINDAGDNRNVRISANAVQRE